MTNPPNYRRVECCGNCVNFDLGNDGINSFVWCRKHKFKGNNDRTMFDDYCICDDYEAEDGE